MDELLEMLSTDDFISGETLCERMGMTRAAVWKRMEKLREEGYHIVAAQRRGYRLEPTFGSLLPAYVQKQLQTKRMGRGELLYAPEMSSTNTVLKQAALSRELTEGSVAFCDRQTAGRGRMQRAWEDPDACCNLPSSTLLRPKLSAEQAALCTLATAVAAACAIEDMGFQPRIKWPNDVVIGGKKCVGILSEMVADMDGIQFIVMGVGFNVNQRAFPQELAHKATSLFLEGGREIDRRSLFCAYLLRLEQFIEALERDGLNGILPDYLSRSVTLGSRVEVIGTAERFVGTAEALDDTGALLVRDDQGSLRRVLSADVSVRGVMGYV